MPHAEPGHLTPPRARIGEEVDEGARRLDGGDEQLDLFQGQVRPRPSSLARQEHTASWITARR